MVPRLTPIGSRSQVCIFWRSGEYLPSRLPGYPVHELLMAPLVRLGGSVATNAATALVALAGVLLLARIARRLNEPSPGLVVIGMAFTPFLIVNSVETKDYLWALAGVLGAYLALIERRPWLAGLLLGLATGCRITSALFGLPFLILLLTTGVPGGRPSNLRVQPVLRPLSFSFQSRISTGRAFSPMRIAESLPTTSSVQLANTRSVPWGQSLQWQPSRGQRRNLRGLPALALRDVHVRVWLVAVALYVLAFLRLPIDIAYLLPIYPFGFLLLGRVLKQTLFAAALLAIVCSGFVDLDLSAMHNFNLGMFARTARPCRSCAELFHDWHVRGLYRNYAQTLAEQQVPPHSVVLTGAVFPDFAVINWDRFQYSVVDRDRASISMLSDDGMMRDQGRDVVYLASPDRPAVLESFRLNGYQVFESEPSGPRWDATVAPVP